MKLACFLFCCVVSVSGSNSAAEIEETRRVFLSMLDCVMKTYDSDRSCTINVAEYKKLYSHMDDRSKQYMHTNYAHRSDLFEELSSDGGLTMDPRVLFQNTAPLFAIYPSRLVINLCERARETLCNPKASKAATACVTSDDPLDNVPTNAAIASRVQVYYETHFDPY